MQFNKRFSVKATKGSAVCLISDDCETKAKSETLVSIRPNLFGLEFS